MVPNNATKNDTNRKGSEQRRTIQHDADFASVQVNVVNIRQRSAFELNPPMPLSEWEKVVDEAAKSNPRKNVRRRISPSYQHLELLHTLQQKTSKIRQIHFSNSTSLDSAYFCRNESGIMEIDDEDQNVADYRMEQRELGDQANRTTFHDSALAEYQRKLQKSGRGGQYFSIDPVKAMLQAIPMAISAPIMSLPQSCGCRISRCIRRGYTAKT
jgi:hypothetical protein